MLQLLHDERSGAVATSWATDAMRPCSSTRAVLMSC
jgi:hypothetical protein